MATVIKEKNGTYTVRYSYKDKDGKRHQPKERGFARKRDAEDRRIEIENELNKGTHIAPNDITIPELANLFVNDYERKYHLKKVEWQTWQYYKGIFNKRFTDWWRGIEAQSTISHDVDGYISYLLEIEECGKKVLSPNTVYKHFKAIRTLFRQSKRKGLVKHNPVEDVDPPETVPPQNDFWDPAIIPDVINLFKGTEIEFHVRLAILTGLREGEICGMHESFFDFSKYEWEVKEQAQRVTGQGIVFKKPKAKASIATLPMTSELEELFKKRISWIKKNKLRLGEMYNHVYNGRLSVREDGSFIAPQQVYVIYRRILKGQDKIPYIRFHDLRHTCAVWHIENGTDMKTLQSLLRHGSYKVTTDTYADATQKLKHEAMSKLSLPK